MLARYTEAEKVTFPEQSDEYSKWELTEEMNRLINFLGKLRDVSPLLNSLISKYWDETEASDKDVEWFLTTLRT